MAKIAKKGPNFTHIRPQKNNFAQIEHLFSLRYCLYEQASSFPGTFIESWWSQDTLGKYFFNGTLRMWQIEWCFVVILAQIPTLSYIVKNFKLGFLKKGSPKKFKTQDLKWSLSTCKKLLKHFFWDIFLFQDISEDRCVMFMPWHPKGS